jgi:arsenate reductase (thioredoxin)
MQKPGGKNVVLFLCTGNSCRSQMVEGFLRHHGGDRFEIHSAGISPAGVNPRAVAVMKEAGVDISTQTSDSVSRELLDRADLVITLCGDARESCPIVPARVEKRHWPLEDPARAQGSEEQIMAQFRAVRAQIETLVRKLVQEFSE